MIVVACLVLIGCASSPDRIGSQAWYEKRLAEIEESYKSKEIDEAQYLQLKNEADAIRADTLNANANRNTHFGYGGSGATIGVGVNF